VGWLEYTRIPVSLKFDRDEFFYTLIEPMKSDRWLSTFIVEMLRLYYEDAEVREAYVRFAKRNEPVAKIKLQLERIQAEHNKSVMAVGALKDYVEDKVIGGSVDTGGFSSGSVDNGGFSGVSIDNRLSKLEECIPEIQKTLDRVLLISQSIVRDREVKVKASKSVDDDWIRDDLVIEEVEDTKNNGPSESSGDVISSGGGSKPSSFVKLSASVKR